MNLPRIGVGCAPIGNLYNEISEQQATSLIRFALGNGANFFDTAPLYGAGISEQRLGVPLSGVPRDSFVVATKVGRLVQPDGTMRFDWTRDGILRSLDESLKRLKLDRVDIVHMHDPDNHLEQALTEAYPVLDDLRRQGVVGMIGTGVNYWQLAQEIMRRTNIDCLLLAGRYTLLEQTSLGFLAECKQRGVRVFLGGVYNSGILATGAVPGAKYQYANAPEALLQRVRVLEELCAEHSISLRAAAVQFALAHPAITSLMIGAQSAEEYGQTLAAAREPVPSAFWQALRDRGLIDLNAPVPAPEKG